MRFLPFLLSCFLLAPSMLLARSQGDTLRCNQAMRTFTKTVERNFSVASAGKLAIDHRYGDLVYNTWPKSEVRIVITISVQAPDEKKAETTFDKVDFEFRADQNSVFAKTLLAANNNDSWSWGSLTGVSRSSNSFKIDYTVWAPVGFSLQVDHRYGDIKLPKMTSGTTINLAYGNMVAAELDGVNKLNLSYGSARIQHVRSLETKLRYGKLHLPSATLVALDSRYSEVAFGRIGDLNIDGGYDEIKVQSVRTCGNSGSYLELKVDSATSIVSAGSYSDVSVGYLIERGEFQSTYGDVRVESASPKLQRIDFSGAYSDLLAQLPAGLGFQLDAQARYGEILVPTNFIHQVNTARSSVHTLQGHFGQQPQTTIVAKTSYGDVVIR